MTFVPEEAQDLRSWLIRVLRCRSQCTNPHEAATAAAAAWILGGEARAATVILFHSRDQFVSAAAHQLGSDRIKVSCSSDQGSVADLFAPEAIPTVDRSPQMQTIPWPERLSVCFVLPADNGLSTGAGQTAAEVLAGCSSQQTLVPNPDHLEAMAEFAAGAGHEINNPLGSIIGQSQLLLKTEQQPDRRQSLATIGAQAWRIRDMIGDCMLFARTPSPDRQRCDLSDVIRKAATDALTALEQPQHRIRFRIPQDTVHASVDSTQIAVLTGHLVRNSVEACLNADLEPALTIDLRTTGSAAVLTVEDRGPGLPDEQQRRHLFDPFYSGRQAGRGIGFGLPVCWQIARNHDGMIFCELPEQGGARFVVGLPLR